MLKIPSQILLLYDELLVKTAVPELCRFFTKSGCGTILMKVAKSTLEKFTIPLGTTRFTRFYDSRLRI